MMKERFTTSKYRYLEMTIENVFRCNFNDTYYHEIAYVYGTTRYDVPTVIV